MCAVCHAEGHRGRARHDIPREQVFERYKDSIHGPGLFKQGLSVAADCVTCHTGHGNVPPHRYEVADPHKDDVVKTCAQCQSQIEEVHRKG